jgi:prepilin-type N-terminal cleavage/methylation domain-containing protein
MSIQRRGMTLVELLIVISIIVLLMAVLLPAVQSVRESARRATCANNLKQIGIGLQSYDATNGMLPPGRGGRLTSNYATSGGTPPTGSTLADGSSYPGVGALSGHVLMLAHMGKLPLYDGFANGSFGVDAVPMDLRQAPLYLVCPSDVPPVDAVNFNYVFNAGDVDPANYFIQQYPTGTMVWPFSYSGDFDCEFRGTYTQGASVVQVKEPIMRGLFGSNSRTTSDRIKDGLSNTLALSECIRPAGRELNPPNQWDAVNVHHGQLPAECWASFSGGQYVQPGTSSPVQTTRSRDFMPGCNWVTGFWYSIYFVARLPPNGPACSRGGETARSRHVGGVHALFADGATRFISENIASDYGAPPWPASESTNSPHGVWGAMATRAGEDPVYFEP